MSDTGFEPISSTLDVGGRAGGRQRGVAGRAPRHGLCRQRRNPRRTAGSRAWKICLMASRSLSHPVWKEGMAPRIEETEKTDLVTQDLLIEIVGALEEARGMWQAQNSG